MTSLNEQKANFYQNEHLYATTWPEMSAVLGAHPIAAPEVIRVAPGISLEQGRVKQRSYSLRNQVEGSIAPNTVASLWQIQDGCYFKPPVGLIIETQVAKAILTRLTFANQKACLDQFNSSPPSAFQNSAKA